MLISQLAKYGSVLAIAVALAAVLRVVMDKALLSQLPFSF